jgi:hypothetical protein
MWVRSGGFYPDADPPGPQPLRAAALVILPVVLVSVVGAAVVLIARALLLTTGR